MKKDIIPAEEYRKPMLIKTYRVYTHKNLSSLETSEHVYPECPRCGVPTDRDYQRFCSYCGQRLKWNFSKMKPREYP